ncbi:MAG: NAD(+)/NADH kinase, partial [Chloroflexi bacterium]|nr:NAD(+)/NADH kinase [Chloroflexota bacterium]
ASWLGLASTLVGVDVIAATDGPPAVLALDVGERDLLAAIDGHDAALVVTPIGGQGFLLGRGNQQLSPAVIGTVLDRAGREGLIVVATPGKLATLGGRPLLVDTGDPGLDARLAGFVRVVTGHGEAAVYRVAAA